MKPKTKEGIAKFILALCFWLGFVILLSAVSLFLLGFHNADVGHNLNLINARYNLTLVDRTASYEIVSPTFLYIEGMKQMIKAVFIVLGGAILFTIGFMGLDKK